MYAMTIYLLVEIHQKKRISMSKHNYDCLYVQSYSKTETVKLKFADWSVQKKKIKIIILHIAFTPNNLKLYLNKHSDTVWNSHPM